MPCGFVTVAKQVGLAMKVACLMFCLAVLGVGIPTSLAETSQRAPGAASIVPGPREEGWESEAIAEESQRLLRASLKLVEDRLEMKGPAVGPGPWKMRPPVQSVAEGDGFRVWRARAAANTHAAESFLAGVRAIREVFLPDAHLHVKIKTVGISASESSTGVWETRHLVHIDGATMAGRREMNGTWVAEWKRQDAEQILSSLRCLAWEEVEITQPHVWFSDQTVAVLAADTEAARQFSYGNAHWRLRLQAALPFFKFGHHGVAIADVNNDGLEDLYVCQPGGLPNRLLLHQQDHTVQDVSAAWNVDLLDSCQCALFADFDNDGDADLVVAGTGPLVIFENLNGKTFEPRIRLPSVVNVYGLAAADYDLDGDVDLYAVRYYPAAGEGGELAVAIPYFDANNGAPNSLIRNDGPGETRGWRKFADATAETGLNENNQRFSFAAVWDDFNRDGRPDLYVANDFGRNNLYLQEKQSDGQIRFRDIAMSAGLGAGAFGMSASTGDFNRDGWPDIHLGAMFSSAGARITTQERFRPKIDADVRDRFRRLARGNSLFQNAAKAPLRFSDVSDSAGITIGRWSWGSLFADINNDTWPDLLVANGFVTGEVPDDL